MHVKHDMELKEETSRLEKHFESLKEGVASLFHDFAHGKIGSTSLLVSHGSLKDARFCVCQFTFPMICTSQSQQNNVVGI